MNSALQWLQETQPSAFGNSIRRVGYAWWGFMADVRMKNAAPFSSPDGSLLHAFSIVRALQKRNIQVYRLYPNRDEHYVWLRGENAFASFSQDERWQAYLNVAEPQHAITKMGSLFKWPDVDLVLCEWRMPTRYNQLPITDEEYEPDFDLQVEMIRHYRAKGVPLICLDLDYKMTAVDDQLFDFVLEPGFKRGPAHHFDVPFLFDHLLQFEQLAPQEKIVYIGNRYDRDEAFERFFGEPSEKVRFHVYGNWKEQNRDSEARWPHVYFHDRIQPHQLQEAYAEALATPLLLKDEYNAHGFMSIRVLEALLFGTIPLLPTQFQSPIKYNLFQIDDQADLIYWATHEKLRDMQARRKLRLLALESLRQHDAKYFVNKLLSVV